MQPVMILATGMKNVVMLSLIIKAAEKKFEKALNEFWPDMEMEFEPNEFDK